MYEAYVVYIHIYIEHIYIARIYIDDNIYLRAAIVGLAFEY
jgi:hypothetical protein